MAFAGMVRPQAGDLPQLLYYSSISPEFSYPTYSTSYLFNNSITTQFSHGAENTWRLTVGIQPLPTQTFGSRFANAFGIALQIGSPTPEGIAPLGGPGNYSGNPATSTHHPPSWCDEMVPSSCQVLRSILMPVMRYSQKCPAHMHL